MWIEWTKGKQWFVWLYVSSLCEYWSEASAEALESLASRPAMKYEKKVGAIIGGTGHRGHGREAAGAPTKGKKAARKTLFLPR